VVSQLHASSLNALSTHVDEWLQPGGGGP
jgi:hypothetical protein